MKRVVVVGASGYIGRRFCDYARDSMLIEAASSRDGAWKSAHFGSADSVLFAAGVAHQKQTEENAAEYFEINTDLAVEVAECAKKAGVRQFIYLSSVSVYGKSIGIIPQDALPHPRQGDVYGQSKFQAEQKLKGIEDHAFHVLIIRPPMVYGPGCKGNFKKLESIVKRVPVFPALKNQRSMIYIDNLCEFIRQGIDTELVGTYVPQDGACINTTEMARLIAQECGVPFHPSHVAGAMVKCLFPFSDTASKAFGTLIFQDQQIKPERYQVTGFEQAVRKSVGK